MDSVCRIAFSPWLSQEKINIALETKRENFIYCRYTDMKKGKSRTGMLNRVTREILYTDPRPTIGLKMFGMALFMTTTATLFRVTMHVVKYPYCIVKIFCTAIRGFVEDLFNSRLVDAFFHRLVIDLAWGLTKEIVGRPLKLIRDLWYSIALELAAIYGFMISPDKGKRLYSLLESELNWGHRRTGIPTQKTSDFFKHFFTTEELFIAPCPHPHAILDSDTFTDSDGREKPRYKLITTSANINDFPPGDGGNCENEPHYFIFPCIPCYT